MGVGTAAFGDRVRIAAVWTLPTLALVLLAIAGWIRFRFGVVSFDQIVLNLPGRTSESTGSPALVVEGVLTCVVAPVAVSAVAGLLLRRRRPRAARPRRAVLVTGTVCLATALGVLLTVAGVPQYAAAVLGQASFAPYYVVPPAASPAPHPRNLVTIYLESGENTFSDESLFGRDLLAGLSAATTDFSRYDGLRQFPGGGWTMAGIVGTQCGIPLKSALLTPDVDHNVFGEQQPSYLPGARCLGDVLADAGYRSVFMGGAHSRFAGKDTFLTDHGYDEVDGLEQWEAGGEPRENISTWGMSDEELFRYAKTRVETLHASARPFNLTLLTLDTHEPGGVYPSCSTDDDVPMKTAIRCSMRAVAGFVDELRASHILDDTVVVIMGDHLKATSEGGAFAHELDATPDRTIILRVWSPDGPVAFTRERADQLSLLPTTLDLLGLGAPDGRAGLGVSLVGGHDLSGTAAGLPEEEYSGLLGAPSAGLYEQFWRRP